MRTVGPAPEFRMELDAHEEGLLRQLHGLHKQAVRRQAGQAQACLLQAPAVLVGKFITVAVAFREPGLPVAASRANSMIATCMPKQIPKQGMWCSRA